MVESFLGALPERLRLQAQQLAFDLAMTSSDTGDLRDAFTGVRRFPLFSLGNWLIDDLARDRRGASSIGQDDTVRAGLGLVSFLGALRAQGASDLRAGSSFTDERFSALLQLCAQREAVELGRLMNRNDGFADAYSKLAMAELENLLAPPPVHSPWSYPARITALAAVHLTGADARPGLTETVLAMTGNLAAALQIWNDLANVPLDLAAERHTYPIAVAAMAAGIPQAGPVRSVELLGAFVTTNALATVLATATAHLNEARHGASEVALPTLVSFIDAVAADTAERRAQLLGRGNPHGLAPSTASSAHLLESTLGRSVAMAERFLLADLTFKESWEIHREGMLGAPEVVSRFPAGLILEILCRRGHDLANEVGEFVAHCESNDFRYYDHPAADPDSDTVGAVLCLLGEAPGIHGMSKPLERILDCVARIVDARGQVPVWLSGCLESQTRPPTLKLGEGCGTVAARLLIGLSAVGKTYRSTFERGGAALLEHVARVGLGANVNYPQRYALAMYLRLADLLGHDPARARLMAELERLSAQPVRSAQEAALAIIATRVAGRPDLADSRWIETVQKQQRFDGSWLGAPFAMAPNRGGRTSAYSTTTLTTALCYDALAGPETVTATPD